MSKRKLALVCYERREEDTSPEGTNNAILMVFNRKLHPLEAMGIVHMVSENLKKGE